jgi:GxxExxY protein
MTNDDLGKLNKITKQIIGLAIEVHKRLGPGFTEKIYQHGLSLEFDQNNIRYEKEKIIKVEYKGKIIGEQRLDFLVESSVIIETKAVEKIGNIHLAQLLSYLKAIDKKIGLILNFANTRLGIKRVIN